MRERGKSGAEKIETTGGKSPLKVLHVIVGLQPGGAETLLYRLVTRSPPEIEHQIICLAGRDWYSPRFEAEGIHVDHLGVGAGTGLLAANRRLGALIASAETDVIQAWMYAPNLLASLWARSRRIPVVWSIHSSSLGPVGTTSRLFAVAGGILARWLAAFVINCSSRSAEVHSKLGYSAAPGAVIANGYDPQAFFPDDKSRQSARRELGITDETFLVGTISRWHPWKDIPTLLRGIRLANDAGVPLRCLLIGRDLDRENPDLARLIREEGCEDLAIPLGRRSDIQLLARALDLHLLASRSEALPNVVAESMLSTTPNVVTDVGDSALMVGETGWVVPARDPQALARAIRAAWRESIDEPVKWQERRSAARRRIEEKFSFEWMAAAYERIWREVRDKKAA